MSDLAILGGRQAVSIKSQVLTQWPPIDGDLFDDFLEALGKRPLNYGKDSMTRDFEEEFALYQQQKYAIGTCSGSVALWAAYYGILKEPMTVPNFFPKNVGASEVIIGGYGFWATASAALYAGLSPVFCDVEEDTGNIDPDAASDAITERTCAIAVTHIDGHPADMETITQIAEDHSLAVIEDCSHAHGATLNGKKVGTFGDAAAFSLQTLKMLSGGEGGLFTTDDPKVFERAAALVNIRRLDGTDIVPDPRFALTGLGLKLRISPLSAAFALHNLKLLDEFIEEREDCLNYLTQSLTDIGGVISPVTRAGCTRGAFYEYPVRYPEALSSYVPKSVFLKALEAEGVCIPKSNTRAFYKMPFFWDGEVLPVTDLIEKETFFLPTFTFEPERTIEEYALAIDKVICHLSELKAVQA